MDAIVAIEKMKASNPSMRVLWTDGSANPNPGPGGFAVIEDGRPVALGGSKQSSNIKMEGEALLAALELLDGKKAVVVTDSEFWINVLTRWAPNWQKNGWTKSRGTIKNLELVKSLYNAYCAADVELIWTRGHVGTEMNEAADKWANKAREGTRMEDLVKVDRGERKGK